MGASSATDVLTGRGKKEYNMRRMGKLCLKIVSVLTVGVCVCGCATAYESVRGMFKKPEPIPPEFAAKYVDGPRVRVGVLLSIQVSTIAQSPVTMAVQVDQSGNITLPLLLQEPVHCDGMKLEELKDKLLQEYSVYYKQPQVVVTFAPVDQGGVSPWGTVTVLGEVASPGKVNMPSTMDLTVTKVIQAAGGMKPFANKSKVQVTRCDREGRQTKFIVDIEEIGKNGRIDKDMTLSAGDVVWVPETWY